MIVTITPLKEQDILVWEAKIEGAPVARSFLWDHAVGILVKNNPDRFGVQFEHRRLT